MRSKDKIVKLSVKFFPVSKLLLELLDLYVHDPFVPRVNLPQIVNITGSTGGSLNVYNSVPVFFQYGGKYPNTFNSRSRRKIQSNGVTSDTTVKDSPDSDTKLFGSEL